MSKNIFKSMIVTGFCLVTAESSQAADMEKCKLVGPDGKGLILAHKCDCASKGKYSCAGQNPAGDPDAWIFVPKGVCEKIAGGVLVK